MKIVPVRNLFQRTELAQPGDGVSHERYRNIRCSSTISGPHKFVVVNNRVPRADALCALCGTKIRQTYVHELQTRFVYCSAQCHAGYQKMMVPARARRVR